MLISFLFHGLFEKPEDANPAHMLPQQKITTQQFEEFILFFKRRGASFVADQDLLHLSDEPPEKKEKSIQILITFDDGYANHLLALPILERHQVPAVFYVTTQPVLKRHYFWWDLVQRHEHEKDPQKIPMIHVQLLHQPFPFIQAFIENRYGPSAWQVDETDHRARPLTVSEVKQLVEHPLTHVGHHTCTHSALTSLSSLALQEEIDVAEQQWHAIWGVKPISFAYPFGFLNETVTQMVQKKGYTLAFGTQKDLFALPGSTLDRLQIPRWTLWGNHPIETQCAKIWRYAQHPWRWMIRKHCREAFRRLKSRAF